MTRPAETASERIDAILAEHGVPRPKTLPEPSEDAEVEEETRVVFRDGLPSEEIEIRISEPDGSSHRAVLRRSGPAEDSPR